MSQPNYRINNVVTIIVWLFAITLYVSYLMGYNLFPITEWVRAIFEPIHVKIFGEQ